MARSTDFMAQTGMPTVGTINNRGTVKSAKLEERLAAG